MKRFRSVAPSNCWSDPDKRSDFKYELSIANEPVPLPYLDANPAFEYIAKQKLESQLYAALDKFAPLLPITGLHGGTTHWYSPSPAGFGTRVIIVLAKDATGVHRTIGSNCIDPRPQSSGKPVPEDLVDRFLSSTKYWERNALLADALNAVITPDWHRAIDKVESEAERFRTMPIYLAVIEATTKAFYCTSAHAEVYGHPAKMDLETVGALTD